MDRERAERRKVIKHKIMAVGRLSRMFSVLRCVTVVLATHILHRTKFTETFSLHGLYSEESEHVSELKNISGSSKLPYGTLVLGAEGIKNAIKSFDDAYVFPTPPISPLAISSEVGRCRSSRYRRKSDIENERLPPPVGERPSASSSSSSTSASASIGSTGTSTSVGGGSSTTTVTTTSVLPTASFGRRKEGRLALGQRR